MEEAIVSTVTTSQASTIFDSFQKKAMISMIANNHRDVLLMSCHIPGELPVVEPSTPVVRRTTTRPVRAAYLSPKTSIELNEWT
ncbi:hypothetical protein ACP70R_047732 [Stipagrostis hirtigluma subsp. patula]